MIRRKSRGMLFKTSLYRTVKVIPPRRLRSGPENVESMLSAGNGWTWRNGGVNANRKRRKAAGPGSDQSRGSDRDDVRAKDGTASRRGVATPGPRKTRTARSAGKAIPAAPRSAGVSLVWAERRPQRKY